MDFSIPAIHSIMLQAGISSDTPLNILLAGAIAGLFGTLMTLVYKFFGLYERQIDADKQKQTDAIQSIARSMESIQNTVKSSHEQQAQSLSALGKALERIENLVSR